MNPASMRASLWIAGVPIVLAAIGLGFQGMALVNSSLFFTWGYFIEVLIAGLLQGVSVWPKPSMK